MVTNSAGHVVRQVLPDHTTFTGFDDSNRAIRGITPGGERFTLAYNADGEVAERFAGGTEVVTNSAGQVIRQVSPDGTTLTGFDDQGRATKGITPGGEPFTISYAANGDVTQASPDGTKVVFNSAGQVIRQVSPDGTTLTGFDDQGRATKGVTPGGEPFTISYAANGDVTQIYGDGTKVVFDKDGNTIVEIMPDGTKFTSLDGQGRPTEGYLGDGSHFKITYDAKGDAFEKLDDGTVFENDANGNPIKMWMPDGTEITWAVDIPELGHAIGKVGGERDQMVGNIRQLKTTFVNVESHWKSPAGASFTVLSTSFNSVTDVLVELLDEAISRMHTAYNNYVATEGTNTSNLNYRGMYSDTE